MQDDDRQVIAAHAADRHSPAPQQVQRWHDAIEIAAHQERARDAAKRRPRLSMNFLWAAVSAALVAGIVIGLQLSNEGQPQDDVAIADDSSQANSTPVAFTRGLSLHLRESQQRISDFDRHNNNAQLIHDIIEQNRRFETVAENNNANDVARILRAFEPILLRLAADDIAPEDADLLRAQLTFELRVMLTKLSQQPSKQVNDDSLST